MKRLWFLFLATLGLINILVWFVVFSYSSDDLRIIACDVGQGDAFIVAQKSTQILIDGGPNERVLQCLSDNMPFWDRVIEVVVLSHPQKDHFAGLIDVFETYEVKNMLTTPLGSGSSEWRVLEELVGGSDTRVINLVKGQKYRLGLIYLDILYPTEEFLVENLIAENNNLTVKQFNNSTDVLGAFSSKKDPNEFSVVLIVSFKDFDALFTGDINPSISDKIAGEISDGLAERLVLSPSTSLGINDSRRIEYIKVPHHGSKNGLSQNLLDAVKPGIAVISVGKNNSYGHPHEEILKILGGKDIRILRTDQMGSVEVITDGKAWWVN